MAITAIDQTADYMDLVHMDTSPNYMVKTYIPSGEMKYRPIEPMGTPYHAVDFYLPQEDITFTIAKKPVELTLEEDGALWKALRDSTNSIAKGRLIK